MEYIDKGTLFDYVKSKGGLSQQEAKHIFRQIMDAVQFCHRNDIYHGDLKLENILISQDSTIKLVDFGCAGSTLFPINYRKGTKAYMAPEIYGKNRYKGEPVDIFALGVILFMMISNKSPFK